MPKEPDAKEIVLPLPSSVERTEIHLRRIEMRGYQRVDGLFDIEGHITDQKPHAFINAGGANRAPNEPIHDMWIRLVVDENFNVKDVHTISDNVPYGDCVVAGFNLKTLIGVNIAKGWSREIKARLSGAACCTHLREMLTPLGSAAYQSLVMARREKNLVHTDPAGKPKLINSCYAYAEDRALVARRWPDHYTGDPALLERTEKPDDPQQ